MDVCPNCGRETSDCGLCQLFRCDTCEQWVSWDRGCGDDAPDTCDDCYDDEAEVCHVS